MKKYDSNEDYDILDFCKGICKRSPTTLFDTMNEWTQNGREVIVHIVYSKDNWPDKDYSLEDRMYETWSNQDGWDYNKKGGCRLGIHLDGSDEYVRLDKYDWKIDYWFVALTHEDKDSLFD